MEINSTQKKLIRTKVLRQRSSLSSSEIERKGECITATILSLIEECDFKSVLVYSDFRNEVPTSGIIEYCLNHHINVGLPCSFKDHTMKFYCIDSFKDLISGYQGILEPDTEKCKEMSGDDSALMILPGVAFDKSGRRLGYGGGFYDRYLAVRPEIFKLGVAYDLQIEELLPKDDFDVLMDMIITESGILYNKGIDN